LLPELRRRHVATADLTALHTALTGRDPWDLLSDKRLVATRYAPGGYGAWRDSVDCIVACFALVILGPLLVLTCIAIALESPGNPIYVQRRVGRYGREFSMFKLRTMGCSAESDGRPHWALSIDPRVTRVGAFLRRSHIDEIPQLWNVMRGEMSMIGPRPERPEFVSWLSDRLPMYSARHHIRPGITGWAQVKLGYAASLRETALKLEYDLFYVRRRSPLLDLAIVLATVVSVARMSGR
jgi:lipopolysaccharide/colanic/teichoic acid biosynthesis glycosyltransferase